MLLISFFDAFLIDYLFWTMNLSVTITGHLRHCKINCIKWLHCAIFSPNEIKIYQNVLEILESLSVGMHEVKEKASFFFSFFLNLFF